MIVRAVYRIERIPMTYDSVPVRPETKESVQELKYDMRVDTFDEVVDNLVETYRDYEQ